VIGKKGMKSKGIEEIGLKTFSCFSNFRLI
jgi:hypothetical protein